jgi:hypothetical protein
MSDGITSLLEKAGVTIRGVSVTGTLNGTVLLSALECCESQTHLDRFSQRYLAWPADPRASRERVGLYSKFRSNYASGASLKEARGTRAFVESHGVAAVVVEDGLRACHGDSARLVGVAPARRGISVAVVQRLFGEEEGVLHRCLIDAAMSEEGERDT